MRFGGKLLGTAVILITVLIVLFATQYTATLEDRRNASIAQLMSLPQYAECNYDETTCPQAEDNVVIPNLTGLGLILLGLLLGIYLIQSDHTHQSILEELRARRSDIARDDERKLIMSVLTKDERTVLNGVRRQNGISQATLRLRTDFSKAKLSTLLAELERRGLVKRQMKGKTNNVYLKRDL